MINFDTNFPLFLICLISGIFIWVLLKSTQSRVSHNLPPIPFGNLPLIGHLHLLGTTPHRSFHKFSTKYGPIIRVFLGSVPCVVACTPETAKEFLKTHESAYSDRPLNTAVTYLTYGSKDFAFSSYGPYWKFMKKIVMSKLLNGKTVDLLYPVRHDEVNRFIKHVSQNAKLKKPVNLETELMKLTNNVMTRMLMNERYSEDDIEAAKLRKVITDVAVMTGTFNLSDNIWLFKNLDLQGFGKKLRDIRSQYDLLMDRIITDHEEARKLGIGSNVKDLLDILLDVAEDDSMEIELTREHMKAFILDVITAGTDTTALTVEWALAELINHPEELKKAQEEIDRVVGKTRLVKDTDIPNLPYLEAIVKETLRLHPPAPLIPRKSAHDCTVAGYYIPANTTIFINVWALNRDTNHWENSFEFSPQRFLEMDVDVRGQNFHMLPFGSGRRMCPGISLALQMLPLTLGAMLQCFEWKAGKDGNLTQVDMEEGLGTSVPRLHPLVCVPVARLDPIPLSFDI